MQNVKDYIEIKTGAEVEAFDKNSVINYIEEESTYWQDFFNERSPALNTYKAGRLHLINSVIVILDCE